MRIRTRLTIAIAAVLLLTIATLGYVLARDTRSALVQDIDDDIVMDAQRRSYKPPGPARGMDDPDKAPGGGSPVQRSDPKEPPAKPSGATPVAVFPVMANGATTDEMMVSERTIASFCFSPTGSIVWNEPSGYSDTPDSPPLLPAIPGPELTAMIDTIRTVPSEDAAFDYRMLVTQRENGDFLITARSLKQVDIAIERLIRTIVITGSLAIAVASLASWFVIRRGFGPVDQMIGTAEKIAAGDLTQRVIASDPHTELGRLGSALNEMLGQVEQAALTRKASETRLRRFIADAAHELRTPLTSLRGYAELYRQGALATSESVEIAMGRIEAESQRMGRLVDDLLLLARVDQQRGLELAPVDIGEVVSEAVLDFEAVEPDRPVSFERAGESIVLGDRHRLRQIIDNLLSNVRTHTPENAPVHVLVSPGEGYVDIAIEDEGPGIEPADRERVFERFWRSDPGRVRSRGGSGLGLAIVASLVGAHGGSVSVENAAGHGARFTVRLPVVSGTVPVE